MVNICILIRAKPGRSSEALKAAKKIKGVKDAYNTYGRYDVVAFAELKDLESVTQLSTTLHALGDIESTETLVEAQ